VLDCPEAKLPWTLLSRSISFDWLRTRALNPGRGGPIGDLIGGDEMRRVEDAVKAAHTLPVDSDAAGEVAP
jgi:hypothetical protein